MASTIAADKGAEALVLLSAGGAALEMCSQAWNGRVGVLPSELKLDVAVELLEAGIAADLGSRGAEEAAERLLHVWMLHQFVSSGRESSESPSSARCLRSLRLASCSVL